MMFCRGGSGADGVYRPEYLCQCSHSDREGLHLTTTLPGEGGERHWWEILYTTEERSQDLYGNSKKSAQFQIADSQTFDLFPPLLL